MLVARENIGIFTGYFFFEKAMKKIPLAHKYLPCYDEIAITLYKLIFVRRGLESEKN